MAGIRRAARARRAGPPKPPGPRIGVVFGAGGALGASWMTGALPALAERLPVPLRDVDVIVGTSAGSVIAAALRCGVSPEELISFQRSEPIPVLADAELTVTDLAGRPPEPGLGRLQVSRLPPLPKLRIGSPELLAATLRRPLSVHPLVGASALLPRGRARHDSLHAMIHEMQGRAGPARKSAVYQTAPMPDWVDRPTWIVAVDYGTGRRVFFGRAGAPPARLADAVAASCSIPGWYEPFLINDRRYVDGGVRSATSVRALAGLGLDEVYVLAPTASLIPDLPRQPYAVVERRVRRAVTKALLREVAVLSGLGVKVTVITPGPEDLAAIGSNLMDSRRGPAVLETSLRTSPGSFATSLGPLPLTA